MYEYTAGRLLGFSSILLRAASTFWSGDAHAQLRDLLFGGPGGSGVEPFCGEGTSWPAIGSSVSERPERSGGDPPYPPGGCEVPVESDAQWEGPR